MTDRLLVALGIAPAAIAGWFAHAALRSSEPPRSPPQIAPRSAVVAAPMQVARSCDTVTLDQIRALLHERPNVDSPSPSSQPEPESTTPREDVTQQLTAIDHAIADGVWSAEDRELLRATVRNGTPELRDAVLSKVVLAINHGQLKEEVPVF